MNKPAGEQLDVIAGKLMLERLNTLGEKFDPDTYRPGE